MEIDLIIEIQVKIAQKHFQVYFSIEQGFWHMKQILLNNQIQKMKKLINPTTYFFQQAEKTQLETPPEIQALVDSLLNKDRCQLCKIQYDTMDRVPRILIHCGHTFCTPCLEQFYMKRRVRCPMCLKLVKQLDSLQRLPINHTIFAYLVQKDKKICQEQNKKPCIKDAAKYLFSQFERVQKQAHRLQNPQKYDQQSGLPFCVFHSDRVQHFFCEAHKTFGCRVCIQIGHSKPDCQVVDLYTVENPGRYQQLLEARIEQPDVSEPFVPSARGQKQQGTLKFGNVLEKNILDDDDDSDEVQSI